MKKLTLILVALYVGYGAMAQNAPFTGDCGETSGHDKKLTGSLGVGEVVSRNGSTDLSSCIQGNNDSFISSVTLQEPGDTGFSYKVVVEGRGPSGLSGGSFYLRFFDETGDYYDLSLWSHDDESHEVSYDSDKPTIQAIMWSDYAFPTDYCTECTALVTEALNKALDEASGCAELVTEFGIECEAAIGGPEDVVGDIICAATGYAVGTVCDDMTFGNLKNNVAQASQQICQAANFCKK